MRKVICLLLAAALTALLGVGVLAAGDMEIDQDSPDQSGSLNVEYDLGVTYTVAIPASVTFTNTEKTAERGLQVSDVMLGEGQSLHVSVSSRNGFQMRNGDDYIAYSMTVNQSPPAEESPIEVLTVRAGETSGWALLDFVTDLDRTHAQLAGRYSDTLTFTVSVG